MSTGINKISAHLSDMEKVKQMPGFNRAGKFYSAFRNTDAYKVSFDWIESLDW